MKRALLLAVVLVASFGLALADSDGKTELTGGVSYSKPADGNTSWSLSGEGIFPLTNHGYLRFGPAVQIVDGEEDFAAFGIVAEINLMGDSGLFFGARGLYDPDASEGFDDHTVDGRVGYKQVVGKEGGGLFKLFAEKTVDGYGKSEDLRGSVLFGLRF